MGREGGGAREWEVRRRTMMVQNGKEYWPTNYDTRVKLEKKNECRIAK